MPMVPPAPGIFLMITGTPQASDSFCPYIRATGSTAPPVGYGTINVIGLEGYACAAKAVEVTRNAIVNAMIFCKVILIFPIE